MPAEVGSFQKGSIHRRRGGGASRICWQRLQKESVPRWPDFLVKFSGEIARPVFGFLMFAGGICPPVAGFPCKVCRRNPFTDGRIACQRLEKDSVQESGHRWTEILGMFAGGIPHPVVGFCGKIIRGNCSPCCRIT